MSLIPALVQELLKIFVGGPKRPPGWNRAPEFAPPCSNVAAKVYFADENVHFYQLHHESELRLPKDCFLTS